MDLNAQPSSSSSSSAFVETLEKIESRNEALTVLEVNLQEPSTSLSSSSLSTKQEEMDKIEDGQEEKKLKMDLKPEKKDEGENKSFIEDLPPEMLMEIQKHLNIKNLLASRLVSRKWNELAREILQSRDDVKTKFYCREIDNVRRKRSNFSRKDFRKAFDVETLLGERETESKKYKIGGRTKRASLENYNKHFEDSKEFPLYTRFKFYTMDTSAFDYEEWIKFISDFGQSIKSLKLQVSKAKSMNDMVQFAGNLRNLLLNQLPNLQEFGIDFSYFTNFSGIPFFPRIQLFPATTTGLHEEKPVQLPQLKVLHLDGQSFLSYTGFVTDLLRAAVNLQSIEPFNKYQSFAYTSAYQLLQSLGKHDCLQIAAISLDADFLSKLKENSPVPLDFKLKKLRLYASKIYEDESFWSAAALFLTHLFESSKDTLRELTVDSFGFLPNIQLPKFSRLTSLTILYTLYQVLPSGLELNEIFPLLQNLELRVPWTDFFPHHENVSRLANLKILKISGGGMTKEDIARISQVCPNLKEFTVYNLYVGDSGYDAVVNFPEVGTAIWTRLIKLETLELVINIDSPANAFPALDSCFTGFSGEDCTRLHDLIKNEQAAKKRGARETMSESKIQLDAERKNPSILDLKDLRNLRVTCGYKRLTRQMLIVSEKCAFQLMKNLTYKIEKEF